MTLTSVVDRAYKVPGSFIEVALGVGPPAGAGLQGHLVPPGAQRAAEGQHREGMAGVPEGAEQRVHGPRPPVPRPR